LRNLPNFSALFAMAPAVSSGSILAGEGDFTMNNRLAFPALIGLALAAAAWTPVWAQGTPDHPSITFEGQSYTPLSILTRNMGTASDQAEQFPPHHIIGNIYYVGMKTLASYLVVTPAGNILLDTTYEKNVPTIAKSVAQLGFKFTDVKIILGNHAHGDHMEGDALAKEMTGGAQVVAMAEDVPALAHIRPDGKPHPIDQVIVDGDTVSLGGTTLTAHLTPGHTHGCTTWTTTATENGQTYNVVFGCSLRAPTRITPDIAAEFTRSFALVRTLPCDVQLGDHPSEYDMIGKYAKLKPGAPNPFIDKPTCSREANMEEAMFHAIMAEQASKPPMTN
jgi:metallo-beta-lactamase class B